ncbi:CubicO group peptidase (beta-lactamase class C family) [Marinoscillum furvescens DSM 4134]|uniref:CubicO group peptidase (Beta-lactamase class C family) n=1 Tax=Marinoscillum furvescens DSM 4134 TaxID=1122208 RepID=A0A3D9L6K4_MARFU|nr:CubicO group peptidase (beta-lactamase class C family) [Marinoscillum furvescens DSM 4134]
MFSSVILLGGVQASESVDSLYRQLSDVERVQQLLWADYSQSQSPIYERDFAGIYFDKPLQTAVTRANQLIAVQLDDRLNPLLNELHNLPDLYTLASLSRSDLLSTYFHYLKSVSQDRGIDFLVLPPMPDTLNRSALVLRQMQAHDPAFFLAREQLAFEPVRKRKEMAQLLQENLFWVMSTEEQSEVQRKLSRYAERLLDETPVEVRVKRMLRLRHEPRTLKPARPLPNQLGMAMSRASVVPLQREHGVLPLEVDTVCFLTNEPYGATANMLRKYAYVITEYVGINHAKAPIVLDNNAFVPEGLSTEGRQLIFIGEISHAKDLLSQLDAALLYSLESDIYNYLIPQQLFGATEATGKLPYDFPELAGFSNEPVAGKLKLGYAHPEMSGLDKEARDKIEAIVGEAIQTGSTPGAQLAIAVDGSIVLDEAYGFLTYDSLLPVDRSTLYDLASVTKVSATLLAVMKLYEQGKIHLDSSLSHYLPAYQESNKSDITIRALLAHNAGLRPYVPFWQKALSADRLEAFYYETEADLLSDKRSYGIRPTPVLIDSLKNWIVQSRLLNYDSVPHYSYSDIGFMVLHQVVEAVSGESMESFLTKHFYQPLGLTRLAFNPLEKGFDLFEIAPTEYDYYFRDELVWGVVHDRNAAVFGGVAGHAGLFANAHELLVVLQTLLQGGSYAEQQLLSPTTIDYFNRRFFPDNRRALGWDKKDDRLGNASRLATEQSFGHTGFTGTMVWADPAYNLIFVFLSNRIHPNADNYQLITRDIRTRIQDVVYEALLAKWMN